MTELTEHFSLDEMTFTQHRALDNTPPPEVIEHLRITAQGLEAVRTILGDYGVRINSGYRSPEVNAAVGGVSNSAHLTGYAADFVCPRYGSPLLICKAVQRSGLAFDQLIEEGTWVHISFVPAMRRQVITKTAGGYAPGLKS